MWKTFVLLVGMAVCAAGCFGRPTTISVPRDIARQCAGHCSRLGMRMGAVVIIMNSAGCVCERGQIGKATRFGAAAVAGGAIIRAAEEEQRRRRQSSSN